SEKRCVAAAEDVVTSYRRTVRELAELPFLRSWNALPDASVLERAKADELIDDFEKAAAKARKNTSAKITATRTEEYTHESGTTRWRFTEDPPKRTRVDDRTAEAVITGLESYVDTLRESRRNLVARYRSEEHTSELQSRENLVCRLLLEKKKIHNIKFHD